MSEERSSFSFLQMAVGVAAAAVVLTVVHLSSTIIAQFLMAFVIAVSVAPARNWLIGHRLRPAWAFLITVVSMLVIIGLAITVVFGSLLFWGFVLAPVGAILWVLMTMIVRLALDSSEGTRGLSYLMSSGRHPYTRENSPLEEAAA